MAGYMALRPISRLKQVLGDYAIILAIRGKGGKMDIEKKTDEQGF